MYAAPIMLLLNTDTVLNPEWIRKAVADIHGKGFDTLCIEFRNCLYNEFDAIGNTAFTIAAHEAVSFGMKVVQIIPSPGRNLLKDHPEDRQKWLVECRGKVSEGRFRISLGDQGSVGYGSSQPHFCGIEKAYLVEWDGEGERIIRWEDITSHFKYSVEFDVKPTVSGEYEEDGELVLFAAYHADSMDYASPNVLQSVDSYLQAYDGLPISGYALDEFGTGTHADRVYHAGMHFLRLFRERYGYEMLDRLLLLNHETVDGAAGKVRFDYFNLTMEITYGVQRYVKERFAARYGDHLFAGFHHTWWGEGNSGDLWAGNLDYFRLADNLSSGFVDAQYDAERTMVSMTLLAESLAKYSDTGIAYNMCWDRYPTPEKMDYYHRLLAVRNVRWLAHAYGRSGDFGPGYPDHTTWEDTGRCIRREMTFQRFIGKAVSRPKVAMLYLWESVAAMNDEFMHYHRLSMKALLDKMMERHIEIDVIPSTEKDLEKYEALIVPWPTMMPEDLWNGLKKYAASGCKLIFFGPPANCTTDGRDISAEFQMLIGARAVPYTAGHHYPGEHEYVAWDMWFTDRKIPMRCYPLTISDGEPILAQGGALLGVRHANVEYYSFEFPLTAAFGQILDSFAPYRELDLPDTVLSKVSYEGEELATLSLTGRWENKIQALFYFRGNEISIHDGLLVGFKLSGSRVIEVISEPGCRIAINGQEYAYDPVQYDQ